MNEYKSNKTPNYVNNIIVELKIISKIKKGEKLNINSKSIVHSDSWVGSFNRSFTGESRNLLILHLERVINDTYQIIDDINDKDLLENVYKNLNLAKGGIQNLLETYKDDINITCKISVIIENVEKILKKYNDELH